MGRPDVDVDKPLSEQLKHLLETRAAQSGRKRGAASKLAAALHEKSKNVSRVFTRARKPQVIYSIPVARELGLAVEYVSLVVVRDLLQLEHDDRSTTAEHKAKLRHSLDHLVRAARAVNPFGSTNRGFRLAIRALRIASKLTGKLADRIKQYERGEIDASDRELAEWARELGAESRDVELRGKELGRAHPIALTTEPVLHLPRGTQRRFWNTSREQPELRWYCPTGAGAITLESSPTVFGAIRCEILTATVTRSSPDPLLTARSVVRCANAKHSGYELSVVTHGALLLSISTAPFPVEDPDATPDLAGPNIVEHRVYRAGEVVGFDSGLYHRCEFLASYNRCVSFNISRSVLVHTKTQEP